jgi:hypothetical protein
MLIQQFHSLLDSGWRSVFARTSTRRRAIEHAIALPCVMGRRTITRTLCALGRTDQDWSADYKIFSRSRWDEDRLFEPVMEHYVERYPTGPIVAAMDDTKLKKTGKKIETASWQRDPLSPPFHTNLIYAVRFLQCSLLFGHYREGDFGPRGIPVRFKQAPVPKLKKPGKKATKKEIKEYHKQYRELKKQRNLSMQALEVIRGLRDHFDTIGGAGRLLLMVADGSFCNRTMFRAKLDRTTLVARCRKDARLCFPAPTESRRKYDEKIFTPEDVRKNKNRTWQRASVYVGGKRRRVRYKVVKGVLWKRGAATRQLRLIVIGGVPYKLSKHSRTNYRDPAYFLSLDLTTNVRLLVQACFDRWQIEVNHRDEKDILGVGQAQVRSPLSVPRHPALAVAAYSMLLLAALTKFGPGRGNHYLIHPKWRNESKRPSFLDMVTLLRHECSETSVSDFLHHNFAKNLTRYADT